MQLTLGTAPGCLAGKLEATAASLKGLQESLTFGLFLDQSCRKVSEIYIFGWSVSCNV